MKTIELDTVSPAIHFWTVGSLSQRIRLWDTASSRYLRQSYLADTDSHYII